MNKFLLVSAIYGGFAFARSFLSGYASILFFDTEDCFENATVMIDGQLQYRGTVVRKDRILKKEDFARIIKALVFRCGLFASIKATILYWCLISLLS